MMPPKKRSITSGTASSSSSSRGSPRPTTTPSGTVLRLRHLLLLAFLGTTSATCSDVTWHAGIQVHDIYPASDLGNRQLTTYEECASWCCNTSACVAFFFTKMQLTDAGECVANQPCCWLKPTFNTTRLSDFCANPGNCMSGNVTHSPATSDTVPRTTPTPTTTTLQANARGMACAQWNHAGSGVPNDCVWHSPPGSTQGAGSPWFGAVDASTGACTAIDGVTKSIGGMQSLHGNFVALDPSSPGFLLGFTNPNYTYFYTGVRLPAYAGGTGTVKELEKVDEPAVWMAAGAAPDCMLSWSFLETIGAGALNLTETLSCVDPHTFRATSLWTNVSSPSEGFVGPAFFGAEHAVDVDAGVLYTQSENQSMGRFDLNTRKVLKRLDTGGKRLSCLHYDAAEKRLGGIVVHKAHPSSPDSPGGMELVSIDTGTGAVTTRLEVPGFPPVGLSLYYIDPSSAPGDGFSPVARPACSFDRGSGGLAFLLVEKDAAVKPAFANKKMHVATMETRNPTVPNSPPAEIAFPFVAAVPLGNRTWRPTMPGLSYL